MRVAPPRAVEPSAWALPDPATADRDGLVGFGADLAPETLVAAYRIGMFPWPHEGVPLPWFSPDPRAVIDPAGVVVSRSLRRRLRSAGWTTTVDADFAAVITACAEEHRHEGTWITPDMQRAYRRLHRLGWAHSLEVWDGAVLVGGLYGVQVGGIFTGESMFHRADDASKAALVDLGARFTEAGGRLLDAQLPTPHLRTMGAVDVTRSRFLSTLAAERDRPVHLVMDRLPVSRLA